MTVQDDKDADRDENRGPTEQDEKQSDDHEQSHKEERSDNEERSDDGEQSDDGENRTTEKPEPDEDDKKAAAEMMEAYKDKPTIVLPGSAGMVSGTAVNEWLDDDGNPKYEIPDDASEDQKSKAEEARNDEDKKQQIEKDKQLNEQLEKAAAEENKGEKE